MNGLQKIIDEWAAETIPDRTPIGGLQKLTFEEIPELVRCITSKGNLGNATGEIADCMILLLDVATQLGIDAEAAVREKMEENRSREWVLNPVTGFYNHVPF